MNFLKLDFQTLVSGLPFGFPASAGFGVSGSRAHDYTNQGSEQQETREKSATELEPKVGARVPQQVNRTRGHGSAAGGFEKTFLVALEHPFRYLAMLEQL